jgi:hypothetical protein
MVITEDRLFPLRAENSSSNFPMYLLTLSIYEDVLVTEGAFPPLAVRTAGENNSYSRKIKEHAFTLSLLRVFLLLLPGLKCSPSVSS